MSKEDNKGTRKMKGRFKLTGLLAVVGVAIVCLAMVSLRNRPSAQPGKKVRKIVLVRKQKKKQPQTVISKDTLAVVKKSVGTIFGSLRDNEGMPMAGVLVSNGIECVLTDSMGNYRLKADTAARFVYYSVPAYCEVPTHSPSDRTAHFYQSIEKGRERYDFTLTRLPGGVESRYKMIVIGDPQVTNAFNPYYVSPSDNPVEMSDVERFATETMVDIRRTIRALPDDMPVYGLSMGDDVQYYGGYNPMLERQIREVLGSSRMRLFSVIGNHDQDGKPEYLHKWEENWGPADYSFDRGEEHYVCFNNVHFFSRYNAYYSPGELSERQMEWLRQDLMLTPKSKKVILCYHIPLTFGNNPYKKAQPLDVENEKGHYSSSRLSVLLSMLNEFEGGYELFCGHTHFAINHEINYNGQHVLEHCHAAACGNIWQSNVNICGTPNGYYVYSFRGTNLFNCYYKGTFWDVRRQMTLFHADTEFNGESYSADWHLPRGKNIIVANVFNADSRWRVMAEENGVEYPMHRIDSRGQDAFATGYHHKYAVATSFHFISKQNSYLIMNHLYYYEPKGEKSEIKIVARDPYGHTFTESAKNIETEPFHNFAHYYSEENHK